MADELIAWSDDFLVHNKTIDEQHKGLVKMTNEFYASCKMGGILARVHFFQTIKATLQYVKTHFSSEEEIMQKANYPELDVHKEEHEDFVARVYEQLRIFESHDNYDPAGFIKLLMDWVIQHIASTDKKYIPYIAKLEQ